MKKKQATSKQDENITISNNEKLMKENANEKNEAKKTFSLEERMKVRKNSNLRSSCSYFCLFHT
jgi:hypothetical protein